MKAALLDDPGDERLEVDGLPNTPPMPASLSPGVAMAGPPTCDVIQPLRASFSHGGQRYLALILDGLRAVSASALSGPAPQWAEINRRYDS